MNRKEFCKKFNITDEQFDGRQPIGGDLYLSRVISLPEGFNPTVGGDLDLRSATSLPEGFSPAVGGYLDLRSVTSLPEGFNPTVGGDLYLSRVISLPEGFNPTVGGNLYLRSVTSLPEGFNPTVGGDLHLQGDSRHIGSDVRLLSWQNGKYIKVDGVFSEVISEKFGIRKLRQIDGKVSYLVTDGENYSHGETIEKARESLAYKLSPRDTSEFKGLKLTDKLPFEKCVQLYRSVTGACSMGCQMFVESAGHERKEYTVKQIIEKTKGQYGHERLRKFFNV